MYDNTTIAETNGAMNPVDAALLYAAAGFVPIPLAPRTKGPKGKEAVGYQDRADYTEDEIREMFPGKGVGILVGRSGLPTLDLDCEEAMRVMQVGGGGLALGTLVTGHPRKPASKYHYRLSDGTIDNTISYKDHRDKKVVEILAGRRNCVMPPSIHEKYEGVYGFNGDEFHTAEELNERIVTLTKEQFMMLAGRVAAASIVARAMPEAGHGRHDYAVALAGILLHELNVSEESAEWVIKNAWKAKGAPYAAVNEAVDCVTSTLKKIDRGEPDIRGGNWLKTNIHEKLPDAISYAAKRDEGAWRKAASRRPTNDAPSHTTLRDRWIAAYPQTLFSRDEFKRYNPASGLWESVADKVIEDSVWRILEDAEGEGIKPSESVVRSVLSAIKARTYRPPDLWDADPNVLVAANGTVNVMSGKLSDHSPDYYATTGVPYDFDPYATCPNWLNLMCWVDEQGEEYLRRRADELDIDIPETDGPSPSSLLQEYVGLALTPETKYEKLLILTGVRGTGKSTIIEGVLEMVGEGRSGGLNIEDVVGNRYGYARIPGKTLLTGTEQPSVFIKYTNKIEALVSGEIVRVEEKYKAGYDFRPVAKIIWGSNELPKIANGGAGIFRRLLILRFPLRLPAGEKDVELKAKIREEAPGILNWALGGLRRLNERGDFDLPHSVKWAVEEFEGVADTESRFLSEVCILGDSSKPEFRIKPADLYSSYRGWCTATGHTPKSATNVALDWERLGLTKKRIQGGNFWCGLKIDSAEFEDVIETHIDKASTNPSRY